MKKILLFVCLLLSVYMAPAQSKKATYAGTINGYSVNMRFKTGQLIGGNVVTGLSETYLIEIQPDGTFSTSFPLVHKQEYWVRFPFFYGLVYFEPGKKLVQDFNIANIPKVSSVFKGEGELALINNDLNKVRPILMDYNIDAIYADIYRLTPEQYKAYFLRIQAHTLAQIDSVVKTAGMSKGSYELARRDVQYNIACDLMHYNDMRGSAYYTKNKPPFNNKNPAYTPVKLNAAYYNFLKKIKYNDPAAMASWYYYLFVNRLMSIDSIYDKAGPLEKARPIILKRFLNTNISLELELMDLQSVSQHMDYGKATLSDADFTRVKSKIKNKFLLADLTALNNKIKQNIRDAKTQTGYTNNQTPTNAPADSFFVKLMDKYKGKVVFIDFWATWCVPCMIGIKEIAPLKEELAQNKDIVFLYITDISSPEKDYQAVIPGIKGEHYRLPKDQYNLLAKQFEITAVPHYTLINKHGGIVANGNFVLSQTDQIKKQLMALATE